MKNLVKKGIRYFVLCAVLMSSFAWLSSFAVNEIVYPINVVAQNGSYLNQFEDTTSYFLTDFTNSGMVPQANLYLPLEPGYKITSTDGTTEAMTVTKYGEYYKYTITESGKHSVKIIAPQNGDDIPYVVMSFTIFGQQDTSGESYRSVTLSNGSSYTTNVPIYNERTVVLSGQNNSYYYKTNVPADTTLKMYTNAYFILSNGLSATYSVYDENSKDWTGNNTYTSGNLIGVGIYRFVFRAGGQELKTVVFSVANIGMSVPAYFRISKGLGAMIIKHNTDDQSSYGDTSGEELESMVEDNDQNIYIYGSEAEVKAPGTYTIIFETISAASSTTIYSGITFSVNIESDDDFSEKIIPIADGYSVKTQNNKKMSDSVQYWLSNGMTATYNYTYFDGVARKYRTEKNLPYQSGQPITATGTYVMTLKYNLDGVWANSTINFDVGYVVRNLTDANGSTIYTNVPEGLTANEPMKTIPMFWYKIDIGSDTLGFVYGYKESASDTEWIYSTYSSGEADMSNGGVYQFVAYTRVMVQKTFPLLGRIFTYYIYEYTKNTLIDNIFVSGDISSAYMAAYSVANPARHDLDAAELDIPEAGVKDGLIQMYQTDKDGNDGNGEFPDGLSDADLNEYGFGYSMVQVDLDEQVGVGNNGQNVYIETFKDKSVIPVDKNGKSLALPANVDLSLQSTINQNGYTNDPVLITIANNAIDVIMYINDTQAEGFASGKTLNTPGKYRLVLIYLDCYNEAGQLKSYKEWVQYETTMEFEIGLTDNPLDKFHQIPVQLEEMSSQTFARNDEQTYTSQDKNYLNIFKIARNDLTDSVLQSDRMSGQNAEYVLHKKWQFFGSDNIVSTGKVIIDEKDINWDGVEIFVPADKSWDGNSMRTNNVYDYIIVTVHSAQTGNLYYTSDNDDGYRNLSEMANISDIGSYSITVACVPSDQYIAYKNAIENNQNVSQKPDAYVAPYVFKIVQLNEVVQHKIVYVDLDETIASVDANTGYITYKETFVDKPNPALDEQGNPIYLPENIDLNFLSTIEQNGYQNDAVKLTINDITFDTNIKVKGMNYSGFVSGQPLETSGSYNVNVSYIQKQDEYGNPLEEKDWIEFIATFNFTMALGDPFDNLNIIDVDLYESAYTEFGAGNESKYLDADELSLGVFQFKKNIRPSKVPAQDTFTVTNDQVTSLLHRKWQIFSNISNGARVNKDQQSEDWNGVKLVIPSGEAWDGNSMNTNNVSDYMAVKVYNSYTRRYTSYTSDTDDDFLDLNDIHNMINSAKYTLQIAAVPEQEYTSLKNGEIRKADAYTATYGFQIADKAGERTRVDVDLEQTESGSDPETGITLYTQTFKDKNPYPTDNNGNLVKLPTNVQLNFQGNVEQNGYLNEPVKLTIDEAKFTTKVYRNGNEYSGFKSGKQLTQSGNYRFEISYMDKYDSKGNLIKDQTQWVEFIATFSFSMAIGNPFDNLNEIPEDLYEIANVEFGAGIETQYTGTDRLVLGIMEFKNGVRPDDISEDQVFIYTDNDEQTHLLHNRWQLFSNIYNNSRFSTSDGSVKTVIPADDTWDGNRMSIGSATSLQDYVVVSVYDTATKTTRYYTSYDDEYAHVSEIGNFDKIGTYKIKMAVVPKAQYDAMKAGEIEKANAYTVSYSFVITGNTKDKPVSIDDYNVINVDFIETYYMDIVPEVDLQAYKEADKLYKEQFDIGGADFAEWIFHSNVKLKRSTLPAYGSACLTMPTIRDYIIIEMEYGGDVTTYTSDTGFASLKNISELGEYNVRMAIIKYEDLGRTDYENVNAYTVKFTFKVADLQDAPGGDQFGDRIVRNVSLTEEFLASFGSEFSPEEYTEYEQGGRKYRETFTYQGNQITKWRFFASSSIKAGGLAVSPFKITFPSSMYQGDYMIVYVDSTAGRETYTSANDAHRDIRDINLNSEGVYQITIGIVPAEDLTKPEREQHIYRAVINLQLIDGSSLYPDPFSKRKVKDVDLEEFLGNGGDTFKEVFKIDQILKDEWYFNSDVGQNLSKLNKASLTIPNIPDYFIIQSAKDVGRNFILVTDDYQEYTRQTGYESLKNIDELGNYIFYVGIVPQSMYENLPEEEQIIYRATFNFKVTDKVPTDWEITSDFNLAFWLWMAAIMIFLAIALLMFKVLYLDKRDSSVR